MFLFQPVFLIDDLTWDVSGLDTDYVPVKDGMCSSGTGS